MTRSVRHIILLFILFFSGIANGQNYPVQAFVQLSPPYSSYLPDYADPFNNQLKILLTLTDYSIPSYQVKLRFSIEGQGYSIESSELTNLPDIILTPGVPTEVSGADLAPYLNTNNLLFSGLDKVQYEESKMLPEGPATICVEVVDPISGAVLGNPACAQSWFSLYDPPLLNLPFCGDEISVFDPQQIIFNWTPLHMASVNNGFTEYVFELYELRPENADPNQVVNGTLPIFIQVTNQTTLNYGITEPQLQIGMSYVWRVQAKDPSGRDLYRNNGYSAVCTFTYGNVAESVLGDINLELQTNPLGPRLALATWNGSSTFDSYQLEVRKTGDPAYQWFPYSTTNSSHKLNSLEPSTEYEARVKGYAGGAETNWSNTATFTTNSPLDYQCGDDGLPGQSNQHVPLDFLLPGMIVQVGQFEMHVTSAEPAGTPGHFNGYGRITVPFILTTLNVSYENIFIDENLALIEGKVEAISQDVDEWIDAHDEIHIDGIISDYESNQEDSLVIFYLDNGDTLTYDWPPPGETLTIIDDSGLIYTVDEYGNVTIVGTITYDNDQLAARNDYQIIFRESDNNIYGFDNLKYEQWTEHYPCIKLEDGTNYFVPYKSVSSQGEDKIYAILRSEEIFTPTFVTGNGIELDAVNINDTTWEITLGPFGVSKKVYGYDNQGQKIGKFNLSVYTPKENELIIVPVNGAQVPDLNVLETSINDVFRQANAYFSVTIDSNYTYYFDLDNNGLDAPSDHEGLSLYSEEMKGLRDAYFLSRQKENKYYLFVVPEISNDLGGYMVRGKSVGFIEEGQPHRTYSHELAHGAFGLKHSFPAIPQGSTNNILDYSEGTHLTHDQWYSIQLWTPTFSIFDNEEDGALQNISDFVKFYHDTKMWVGVDDSYGFVLLDGTPVKIPGITEAIFDIKGKVYKFKTATATYMPYFAESTINSDQHYITGYYTEQEVKRFVKLPANSNELKDTLKALRFTGFGNINATDTLFSKFPKIEFGVYVDCICEQRWEADTAVNAGTYISSNTSNWYFPKMIKYSIAQKGVVVYSDCSGNCFDYSSFNVEGPAEVLIPQLSQHFSSHQDIIDIVEFIHAKIPLDNTFVFYNSEGSSELDRYFTTLITDKIPADDVTLAYYLVENQINTLAKFKATFGENTSSSASDVNVIFSKTDLWEGINKQTYNQYSIDHVITKETGNNLPYNYCYKDLVYRDKYRIAGGFIFTGIQKMENTGTAEAIYLEASYDQYVAQYGTNSAFYSILESFTETMGPIFLAYGGRQIVNILGPEIFASGNNALSNIFRANVKNFIKTYVSIRTREAIITGLKSYVAYMIIDATLRVICDLSPDFQTAFMEVNQGAAMLQGVTDGVATYVDLPDVEIASFLAISNCIIGTVETSEQSAQVQEQSCLFSALVSVIVSSGGNIKTIIVKRILALTTAAKNTLKTKLSGVIASDHWIWSEVFGVADNVTILTKLDNLIAKPHVQQFIADMVAYANGNITKLARYGNVQNLKNTLKNLIENPAVNNVKNYDQLLDDIEHFMQHHRNTPGALDYFDELVQSPSKFKGGAFGLEILANPPPGLVGKPIESFEMGFLEGERFRFDIKYLDGNSFIFVETKNYASKTSFSSSFYGQFKAYFSNPEFTSLSQLRYYFRANSGVSKARLVDKFKSMINSGNRKQEIFDAMSPFLKDELEIELISDLDDDKLEEIINAIIVIY